MPEKRLYRTEKNRILGGVCGGIAEYFEVDPTLIRLLWIAFTFAFGGGLLAYIIGWIIIPEKSELEENGGEEKGGDDMTKEKDGNDDEPEALFIPAGVLGGMGFGFLYGNIPAGLFIGLGVGFALFAIISIMKKRR